MKARNPILPTQYYFPDGEPHFINGELYIYPSCDVDPDGYCSDRLFVAHSKDLAEWKVDGPVFETSALKCISYGNGLLYAPDSLTADGKSYLFFCTSDGYEGVAFSDCPSGPFHSPVIITDDKTGEPIKGIDPAVFLDDDGKAYLYWGQFSSYGAELTEDFTKVKAETIVHGIMTEKEHGFHEGSSMRKIGKTYYYIFADIHRGRPTALGYATSNSPLGPFEYQGVIIDNLRCDPETWNNHGSIEQVNGQWYVFYHRSTNNSEYLRRMCAEPIEIDTNGCIKEVIPTSIGMGEPYKKGERLPGYQACRVSGAYICGNILKVKKGTAQAVFRYLDKSALPLSSVSYRGTGNARLAFKTGLNGELEVIIESDRDIEIDYFEID